MKNRPSDNQYQKALDEKIKRFRELAYVSEASEIIRQNKSLDEVIDQLIFLIKRYAVIPNGTSVRISCQNKKFLSPDFHISGLFITEEFNTLDGGKGDITIYYSKDYFPDNEDIELMLRDDIMLIRDIGRILSDYIDRVRSKAVFEQDETSKELLSSGVTQLTSRKLLQLFLDKHNADRDLFHDLMPFKVREILLVASLYDAYSIEGEEPFTDHILGEYHQLNLTFIPRITAVSSGEEALNRMKSKHFDQVIIMIGADKKSPIRLYRKIKKAHPYLPTYLLLNNNNDIPLIRHELRKLEPHDHFFVWNGDSKVFFAMVKLLEEWEKKSFCYPVSEQWKLNIIT